MSFAKEVKEELSKIKCDKCCEMAELSALLWLNSEVSMSSDGLRVEYQTTNPTISRRLITLIKDLYDVEIELLTKERERLNKRDFYIIRIIKGADKIIYEHGLIFDSSGVSRIKNECCKDAFIRGAFLATGSINDPTHSYHLEIACNNESETVFLQKLINEHGLNAKITKRRNTLIVYIKEAAKIADMLNIMGSKRMYFQYEDTIIKRDISNSINRVINVELANEQKTQDSSKTQIREINFLLNLFGEDKIDKKMLYTMKLRIDNPDASLSEMVLLANEDGVSLTKSGLNHRFRKIHELYLVCVENSRG